MPPVFCNIYKKFIIIRRLPIEKTIKKLYNYSNSGVKWIKIQSKWSKIRSFYIKNAKK